MEGGEGREFSKPVAVSWNGGEEGEEEEKEGKARRVMESQRPWTARPATQVPSPPATPRAVPLCPWAQRPSISRGLCQGAGGRAREPWPGPGRLPRSEPAVGGRRQLLGGVAPGCANTAGLARARATFTHQGAPRLEALEHPVFAGTLAPRSWQCPPKPKSDPRVRGGSGVRPWVSQAQPPPSPAPRGPGTSGAARDSGSPASGIPGLLRCAHLRELDLQAAERARQGGRLPRGLPRVPRAVRGGHDRGVRDGALSPECPPAPGAAAPG